MPCAPCLHSTRSGRYRIRTTRFSRSGPIVALRRWTNDETCLARPHATPTPKLPGVANPPRMGKTAPTRDCRSRISSPNRTRGGRLDPVRTGGEAPGLTAGRRPGRKVGIESDDRLHSTVVDGVQLQTQDRSRCRMKPLRGARHRDRIPDPGLGALRPPNSRSQGVPREPYAVFMRLEFRCLSVLGIPLKVKKARQVF